jgi:glycosyltransferase involved in cell wall biosynthesis
VLIYESSSVRILHILGTPRAEGTPNLVLDWLAAGSGHWQGIVALNSRPADLTPRLRAAADVYEEHDLFDRGRRKFPAIAAVTYRAVLGYRPDVVICWSTGFSPWVCAGAFVAGCRKLIVHAGNPAGQDRKSRWITKYVTWPLAMMRAKVICCSKYVEQTYRVSSGIGHSLFHTVYNCTRAPAVAARAEASRAAEGDSPRRPTAIMVATLEAHKDHATMLLAVPQILAAFPDFRLLLVGAGTFRERIERQIAELGIDSAVELLGMRLDVPELLGRSDAFVFSTTPQEGLGSVLLEALAARVPVVATDVPACRELLADGRWGKLVPPRDPEALAAAVIAVFRRPLDQREWELASAYAGEFTGARMIHEYVALLRGRIGGS